MLKALILDRDGTLIENIPNLCDPAQVRLLPRVPEALARCRQAGVRIFLHTNQAGVGRGELAYGDVKAVNAEVEKQCGIRFDGICIGVERDDAIGDAGYRKPSPRYARELMRAYRWKPSQVCYVGDSPCDLEAAARAGTVAVVEVNNPLLVWQAVEKLFPAEVLYPHVDTYHDRPLG